MNRKVTEFGGINGAPLFRTIRATCEAFNIPQHYLRALVIGNKVKVIYSGNRAYINQNDFLEILKANGWELPQGVIKEETK